MTEIREFFDAFLKEFVTADEEMADTAIFAVKHLAESPWAAVEELERERETMAMVPRTIEKTQIMIEDMCENAGFALGEMGKEDIRLGDICKKHYDRLKEIKTIAEDVLKEQKIEKISIEDWIRMALEAGAGVEWPEQEKVWD